jgi:two-component system, NarL family, response regulator DevR
LRCAVLVEQHAVFRQAMARLLERHHDVELVEEAATVAEARAKALGNLGDIDVVVSELALPDGEATGFLAALREAEADVPVLVLTFREDRPSRERALELGAARVMSKDASVEEIFAAIRKLGGSEKV